MGGPSRKPGLDQLLFRAVKDDDCLVDTDIGFSTASPLRKSYEGLETEREVWHFECMSSVEPARHALYSVLQDVLGEDHADTLMTHLPQHPSDEVATKDDIARLDTRFDRLEDRFDRLEDALRSRLKTYTVTVVTAMTALTAIFSLIN